MTPGPGAPARPVNEIFLVQLTRPELELVLGHVAVVYAVRQAEECLPKAVIFGGEEGIQSLADWIATNGAKAMSALATQFYKEQGLEGLRRLSNKFLRLIGRPEL